MKFVEKHLTMHHFLRAPHKWFFAFLASPIHFLEMHYKNTYHLKFSHARKLFLFDMSLVGLLIAALIAGIFWSTYNPTVTDLVYVTITPSKSRILSGEHVEYSITYINESDVKLINAELTVTLPQGFILERSVPEEIFTKETQTFALGTVDAGESGSVSVAGLFYGTPNVEDYVQGEIMYIQDGKKKAEKKRSPHIVFLRGSVMNGEVVMNDQVVEGGVVPFTVHLTNSGEEELRGILFPLNPLADVGSIQEIQTTKGSVVGNTWSIDTIKPEEKIELKGVVHVYSELSQNEYEIALTPSITVYNQTINQSTVTKKIQVVRPRVQMSASWETGISQLKPGESGRVLVSITNTGAIALENGSLELPLPASIINMPEAARSNAATISGNTLVLHSKNHPMLASMAPGESRTITIVLPIRPIPDGGVDVTIKPSVRFQADAVGVSNATLSRTAEVSPLKVGTQLILTGEVRYYTLEGDQLGRGPLPPQVGKETKYALLLNVKNTTSNVSQGMMVVKLPAQVVWTGKVSVTQGVVPQYNSATREVRWAINSLNAHATAGLFAELAVIPSESQKGSTITIIEKAEITAFDTYLGYSFLRSIGTIDNSLSTDSLGRAKGVNVQ